MNLKSVLAAAGTLIFIFALAVNSYAQVSEKRIAEIKKIVAETNRMVEIADRPDENSSVFVVELNVNRKENPYPAIGTYTSTAKFYYTYGDREKNPYPDRLIKVSVETRRSSVSERTEICFDNARAMVLYIKQEGEVARHLYFSAGRLIRFERNGKLVRSGDEETPVFLKTAMADKIRLMKIFQASLD